MLGGWLGPGEEAFRRAGDFLGLVASNLIAGECVIEREEGAGLKTRLYNRWKRAYANGEEPG